MISKKEVRKRLVVLAKCPVPKDISSNSAKRPQYSIKDKKKLGRYIVRHNLSVKEAGIATKGCVSPGQIRAWKRDYIDGRYNLSLSVSVSRS